MSDVAVPEGINDARGQTFTEIINERWNALPIESALVWHLASADEPRVNAVAEVLGLTGPEFRATNAPPAELVAEGVLLRRMKGTPYALREVLRRLNYGEVVLIEDTDVLHNGAITRNGERRHASYSWATFIIFFTVTSPFTTEQVQLVWDVIDSARGGWSPKRSHIVSLGFRQAGQPTAMYFARP